MSGKAFTHEECGSALGPVQDALYVLNGKWKLPVIIALNEGHKRFTEIQKAVKGIAAKVLSNELKQLELNGFVIRHSHDGIPVSVEYELTAYSATLKPVLDELQKWGTMHRNRLREQIGERRKLAAA